MSEQPTTYDDTYERRLEILMIHQDFFLVTIEWFIESNLIFHN